MSTIINAKYYAEAGAFVSKDKSRYVLHAIRIEPHPEGGAVIVATDGHTLGLFHDAEAICEDAAQVQFRPEIARLCIAKGKADKDSAFVLRMQIDEDLEIIEALEGSDYSEEPLRRVVRFFDVHAQGAFPNWRMVLPQVPAKSHLDFNSEYLARGASSKVAPGISVWSEKPDAQAVVRSSREDFIAVVMPMKGVADSPYPPYVRALLKHRPKTSDADTTDLPLFEGDDKPKVKKAAATAVEGNGADKTDLPSLKSDVAKKRSGRASAGAH